MKLRRLEKCFVAGMVKMNTYYKTKYDKVSASDYQQIAEAK